MELHRELRGRPIVEGISRGRALVSRNPLSFLGGVDPQTGVVIERNHDLNGRCIKDAILCFPHGHGSTVGSYVLYSLARRGLAPKAIVNERADPVVVVGGLKALSFVFNCFRGGEFTVSWVEPLCKSFSLHFGSVYDQLSPGRRVYDRPCAIFCAASHHEIADIPISRLIFDHIRDRKKPKPWT